MHYGIEVVPFGDFGDPNFVIQVARAAEKAGCPANQLLHVGDSVQTDVIGAANAGILCVWLNRRGFKSNVNLIDYEITSLLELLEIIE